MAKQLQMTKIEDHQKNKLNNVKKKEKNKFYYEEMLTQKKQFLVDEFEQSYL